jgi:hypothetical protein
MGKLLPSHHAQPHTKISTVPSRRGADRLLQVRCALYNGTLGTGFGQRFHAANDPLPQVAAAA